MASMIKKMSFAGTHMQVLHHPHPSRKRKKSQAVKPRIGSQNDSQRFRFLASLNVTRYEMEKTTEEIHDHEKEIHSIARKGSIARHILKSNKESVQDVLDVLESRCASKLTSRQSSARRVAFYNSLNVEDSPKSQRPDTIYAYRSNWSRSPLLELRGKESKSTKLRAVNQIDILEDLKQASFSRRIKRLMEAEKNAKLKETARKSSNKLFQKSEDDSKRQIEKFRRVVTSVIDINTGFGKILETRRHLAEERRKREEVCCLM